MLRFFGKYSYGMYVFQNLLIPVVASWLSVEILQNYLGSQLVAKLTYLTLMSALTIAAALASWHLFEKHVLKLKFRFE